MVAEPEIVESPSPTDSSHISADAPGHFASKGMVDVCRLLDLCGIERGDHARRGGGDEDEGVGGVYGGDSCTGGVDDHRDDEDSCPDDDGDDSKEKGDVCQDDVRSGNAGDVHNPWAEGGRDEWNKHEAENDGFPTEGKAAAVREWRECEAATEALEGGESEAEIAEGALRRVTGQADLYNRLLVRVC